MLALAYWLVKWPHLTNELIGHHLINVNLPERFPKSSKTPPPRPFHEPAIKTLDLSQLVVPWVIHWLVMVEPECNTTCNLTLYIGRKWLFNLFKKKYPIFMSLSIYTKLVILRNSCRLTFKLCRWFFGPIPDSMSIFGVPTVPAESMTSLRARACNFVPFRVYSTPIARLPLNKSYNRKWDFWIVLCQLDKQKLHEVQINTTV